MNPSKATCLDLATSFMEREKEEQRVGEANGWSGQLFLGRDSQGTCRVSLFKKSLSFSGGSGNQKAVAAIAPAVSVLLSWQSLL